jgi:arylsulfatase A-like enzyme
MRRAVALTAALGLSLVTASPAAAQESALPTARVDETPPPEAVAPDIVIVMADDLGYVSDERHLRALPSIRDLWLDGGLRLERMYDQTPLCSPSRASLLTGKDTLDHGVTRNDPRPLDDQETIVVALDEAGYHTLMAGKYLNHYDGSVVPPGWDHAFMLRSEERSSFWSDGQPVRRAGHFADDVIRQAAVGQVRDAPTDAPLLSWVSMGAPHVCEAEGEQCYTPEVMPRDQDAQACSSLAPFKPPSYTIRTNRREVREMPPWPRGWRLREVCESLLVVDRAVGQLVEAQAARGRPAIFILMSDNGMSWGQKGFSLKHTPPATRAPFYVTGTGVPVGSSEALLSKIDVAPTLAEAARVELPWADGTSFLPLLQGEPFDGRGELLEVMPGTPDEGYVGWQALRTPAWRFIRWRDGKRELYDLATDPWELRDVVADETEQAARLEARLDELLAASSAGTEVSQGVTTASPAPTGGPSGAAQGSPAG